MKNKVRITGVLIEGLLLFGIGCILLIHLIGYVGIETYIVRSGSMEPAIWTGSLCFVDTQVAYSEIEENDIIAYKRGNLLVTHRVVQILNEGFVTKGDNNDIDDGLTTTEDNYIGKSIFSIPLLGYVVSCLQTDSGKIIGFVFVLSISMLHLGISKKIIRETDGKKDKFKSVKK